MLIIGYAQAFDLIVSFCQQFSIDDLFRVVVFSLKKQIFVATFLNRLHRIVTFLIPLKKLVGRLDVVC